MMPRATRIAINTGVGVLGAAGSAMLTNALPIVDPRAKALTQAGVGAAAIMFTPRRMRLMKIAGVGACMAGGLTLARSMFNLPALSGWQNMFMGVTRDYSMGRSFPTAQDVPQRQFPAMGVVRDYSMGAGYGEPFITAAQL